MIEIVNKKSSPLQLIVRSKRRAKALTTLIVPGRGRGHNVVVIADEMKTEYIDRAEGLGLISTRSVDQV